MTCPAGTTCCNPSCGVCTGPGEGCDDGICSANCSAQDAFGEGFCAMFLGTKWDGRACKGIGGCSCAGADCGDLFMTPEECEAAYSGC